MALLHSGNIKKLSLIMIMIGMIMIGIVLLSLHADGVLLQTSNFLIPAGLFLMLFGVARLCTQKPLILTIPHRCVFLIAMAAIALHFYIFSDGFSNFNTTILWAYLFSLVPYVVCLIVSSFPATHLAAIAGATVSLVLDLIVYYYVIHSKYKDALDGLVYLILPFWQTLILVPFVTFLATLIPNSLLKK